MTVKTSYVVGLLITTMMIFLYGFSPIAKKTDKYPQDYFINPITHHLRLSGTFGELRTGHFHSGIDIKSPDGRSGHPVVAAAGGTVARIKVSAGGYGRAIYLRHPNGYTTVYAHLKRFAQPIEQWVKAQQYRRKSFEVDLYPTDGQFRFEQGDLIGLMGNSGASSGPHLHFEIRKTLTQQPINPLLFGLPVRDNTPPRMYQLKVYSLNDKLETLSDRTFSLRSEGPNRYRLPIDTLIVAAWRVGFGLQVFDLLDHTPNRNGIYRLRMYVNDSLWYVFEMERFSFAQTRYLNAHADYAARICCKDWFNRTYLLPGNRLKAYPHWSGQRGALPLYKKRPTHVRLLAEDAHGNQSELTFWIRRGQVKPPPPRSYNAHIPWASGGTFRTDGLVLHVPKSALYQDLYLYCDVQTHTDKSLLSPLFQVGSPEIPLHRWANIGLSATKMLPAALRDKAFVGWYTPEGKLMSCGGQWQSDGMLHAQVRQLGYFTIGIDTIPPQIKPVTFSTNMKGYSQMRFRITDNQPTTGKARGLRYRATVDGQWILMEYDAKSNLLIHRFDGRIGKGEHSLRIEVTDDRGNTTLWENTFVR